MIPPEIQRLFDFINYLDRNKTEFLGYIPICNELIELDHQRSVLSPEKNYMEKLLYDDIQNQIEIKMLPITDNIYKPVTNRLRELGIWSGDYTYSSIWNNSISSIYRFHKEFKGDDVDQVLEYKRKYIAFRSDTNTNFLCLGLILNGLDDILKELFNFFTDTDFDEFEDFAAKRIYANTTREALDLAVENVGKNIIFSLASDATVSGSSETQRRSNTNSLANEKTANNSDSTKNLNAMKEKKDVFVTYAWDNQEHKNFVYEFVNHLRSNGFDAEMDTYKSQQEASADFMKMMHQAMTDYKKVIVVLSEKYKEKAESFEGGVGTEYGLIIKDIRENVNKYILVSADGHGNDVTPMEFRYREIIDISRPYKPEMMNRLYGKLSDQATIEFHPVGLEKPELTVVRPSLIQNDKILINDISLRSGGAQLFEGQYRTIEYGVRASIKNQSNNSLQDIVIEIEMPSWLCNGHGIGSIDYRNDDNYREEKGRSVFTFQMPKVAINQTVSSKWVNIEVWNNIIDEVYSQNLVVRVFTDTTTTEREFPIKDFLIDSNGKALTLKSFRTKNDQYRQE
ncbi:TIR domain-containing protein [Dyadobacter chenwenxiniae]|uniref:TIR domain-containing protein n=1 Tax=Dyadobacter chenwenxiniae TaxID=2906456 RepID=A0A9X1PJ41_9BACT|nr:SEFIR domain-containing protein [Dyadobacter chenwenxiniae]MCF0061808.1 TIR domain-containing protein [Dyadobacter chenwenxiniae]UON81624.1 TIR domain-containing protein [Dyadobacter chenwenxiniae]